MLSTYMSSNVSFDLATIITVRALVSWFDTTIMTKMRYKVVMPLKK